MRRARREASDRELVCERAVSDGSDASPAYEASFAASEAIGRAGRVDGGNAAGAPPVFRRRPRARGGVVRCGALEKAAYSSRLVFLAIKCAWEIDEEGVARVAVSAGVGREWLAAAVEQARRSLEGERSRVESLVQRRNASWFRQRILEARFAIETDAYRRARLSSALARENARCAKTNAELGCLRTIVPNSIVARILGVPKGTVDSGLYYLRKRFGPDEG